MSRHIPSKDMKEFKDPYIKFVENQGHSYACDYKELILKVFRATSCCFNGEMYEEDSDSEILNILGPHLDLVEE